MSSKDVTQSGQERCQDIAIVGSGLVGPLAAIFLAKRGFRVTLYDYREDPKKSAHEKGRSINLALSHRGRVALREVGLEDHMIRNHGIGMVGRMMHFLDGTTKAIPYDILHGKKSYSINRRYLNELLIKETEKYPNIKHNYKHKLINANFKDNSLTFLQTDSNNVIESKFNLVIGADGAYSAVRRSIIKEPMFNYEQTYIQLGYVEFQIPNIDKEEFALSSNYIHIWPRGSFILSALPNQDRSWTVTLFMPFTLLRKIETAESILHVFKTYFAETVPLIGEKKLVEEFFAGSPSTLLATKCHPYHVPGKALLIGDAAHAVVPFYGQGMNCGFEDCYLLDKLLQKHGNDGMDRVLEDFTNQRWEDGHAIVDLTMRNFLEISTLVSRLTYMPRKKLDDFLHWALSEYWLPLHYSVLFTSIRYSECLATRNRQDKIVERTVYIFGIVGFILIFYVISIIL